MNKASFKQVKNEEFYKADGSFDVDKAKQVYYDMMAYYNYPIVPRLKGEEFWAVDFGLGQFTEVGMAGIFWVNNYEDNYFGHEIYLLPGQMIPEHCHMRTDKARPENGSLAGSSRISAYLQHWRPHTWCDRKHPADPQRHCRGAYGKNTHARRNGTASTRLKPCTG